MKPKSPAVPAEHAETVRRAIRELLEERPVSAREISGTVRIPEKEVAEHLEHLRRSLHGTGLHLELVPPECRSCGFVFRKRERLTKPGKCPACGGTFILEPLFEIR
jgi:transcriptional regulator